MAIELQLVGLAVVMPLYHLSGVVDILGINIPDVLYEYVRRVRQLRRFFNIIIQVIIQFFVPLFKVSLLVEDDYAESLGMYGIFDKGSDSVNKL